MCGLFGCLGTLALLIAAIVGGISYLSGSGRRNLERQRLNALLVEYCSGTDQSLAKVNQIRAMLMLTFAENSENEALAAATASFAPGGLPPFHDEAWLEDTFRVFLRGQGITVPDYGKEQPGVWPPPPSFRP